jgi:hypothetical protein
MAYPAPYPNPPAPYPAQPAPVQYDQRTVQELSVPIHEAKGWLKFLGVLSIIAGAGQALSLVGILWAWLPIWMGILMFQAGSNIESAAQFGDKYAFLRSMGSLKTYFVLQGVLTLISIILVISALCIVFVLPLLGLGLSIPFLNNGYNY